MIHQDLRRSPIYLLPSFIYPRPSTLMIEHYIHTLYGELYPIHLASLLAFSNLLLRIVYTDDSTTSTFWAFPWSCHLSSEAGATRPFDYGKSCFTFLPDPPSPRSRLLTSEQVAQTAAARHNSEVGVNALWRRAQADGRLAHYASHADSLHLDRDLTRHSDRHV